MTNYKIWVAQVTTSTTTTTTTATYSVTVYANYLNDPTSEVLGAYAIYYEVNGGGDNLLVFGDSISTTCANVGTITGLSIGDSIAIGFTTTGKIRTARNFDGDKNTTTCPNTGNLTYCGTNNIGGTPLTIGSLGGNTNVALTIYSAKGIFSTCP